MQTFQHIVGIKFACSISVYDIACIVYVKLRQGRLALRRQGPTMRSIGNYSTKDMLFHIVCMTTTCVAKICYHRYVYRCVWLLPIQWIHIHHHSVVDLRSTHHLCDCDNTAAAQIQTTETTNRSVQDLYVDTSRPRTNISEILLVGVVVLVCIATYQVRRVVFLLTYHFSIGQHANIPIKMNI